jgi:hypothetical protein
MQAGPEWLCSGEINQDTLQSCTKLTTILITIQEEYITVRNITNRPRTNEISHQINI